ncbi:uncharacterized protein LOC121859381 [Homarus americanus]|uniref:uncharacterized protein LOC121859381 n=1 Tax=Homarus americanus TaxID=6706 RepID=UPI001C4936D9|nr:uncharacterized protein LOC121859381 [Homarus americanus]
MEQPSKHARQRGKETINVDVKLETTLTNQSCAMIVEGFLKYILYQRNQIPVQFDTLEREVAKTEGTPSHHSEVPTPQEHTADKVYSRKEEIARRTLHSKRQRWLTKVNNFLEVFNTVMQTLRTELNDGNVMAVNVILGSSIISGQEVFSIIFPRDCSSAPAECEVSNGRQTAMQFFR